MNRWIFAAVMCLGVVAGLSGHSIGRPLTLDLAVDDDVEWVNVVEHPSLYEATLSKDGTFVRARLGNGCTSLYGELGGRVAMISYSPDRSKPSNLRLIYRTTAYGVVESCRIIGADRVP
jgi:hypothetical protein